MATVVLLSAVALWAFQRFKQSQPDGALGDVGSRESVPSIDFEPVSSQTAENVPSSIVESASCHAGQAPGSLEDYEDLARKVLQKGVQELGPKFSKGAEVHHIVQNKMASFSDKVKTLVTNELNDTAGSIAKVLDMEECMLLLDWDAAIAANFPPISVLLAGVLVPVNLAISKISHIGQTLTVLLPVLILCILAEYADWNRPCGSIPGIRAWVRITGVLALTIIIGRLVMLSRVCSAQADLQRKSAEVGVRLRKAEAMANNGEARLSDLKELLVSHVTTLQYAVVCESRTRTSIFSHIVGAGTLMWLLTIIFAAYLYFTYMFIPGVVAFHPTASDHPSYCAAWVTVCSVKVALLLGILFFFVNLLTVLCWAAETTLHAESVANKIAASAKDFDSGMMGIPVMQLLVKSFLLRGTTDVLSAQFAVAMREKSVLAQEYADTERRLVALKAQIEAKEAQTTKMKQDMISVGGGTMEALAQRLSSTGLDMENVKDTGASIVEVARERAKQVENATTEEIEHLVMKLQKLMNHVAESESLKQVQARAEEMARASMGQAQEAPMQVAEKVQDSVEHAPAANAQAGTMAEAGREQA